MYTGKTLKEMLKYTYIKGYCSWHLHSQILSTCSLHIIIPPRHSEELRLEDIVGNLMHFV